MLPTTSSTYVCTNRFIRCMLILYFCLYVYGTPTPLWCGVVFYLCQHSSSVRRIFLLFFPFSLRYKKVVSSAHGARAPIAIPYPEAACRWCQPHWRRNSFLGVVPGGRELELRLKTTVVVVRIRQSAVELFLFCFGSRTIYL